MRSGLAPGLSGSLPQLQAPAHGQQYGAGRHEPHGAGPGLGQALQHDLRARHLHRDRVPGLPDHPPPQRHWGGRALCRTLRTVPADSEGAGQGAGPAAALLRGAPAAPLAPDRGAAGRGLRRTPGLCADHGGLRPLHGPRWAAGRDQAPSAGHCRLGPGPEKSGRAQRTGPAVHSRGRAAPGIAGRRAAGHRTAAGPLLQGLAEPEGFSPGPAAHGPAVRRGPLPVPGGPGGERRVGSRYHVRGGSRSGIAPGVVPPAMRRAPP